jgi:hypothetical protein
MAVYDKFDLRCTQESADEGTDRKKADDRTGPYAREGARGGVTGLCACPETSQEVVHEENVADLSRVILCTMED